MTLFEIAETHRVRVRRDSCGDLIIAGQNGHLCVQNGHPTICFTDDGRRTALTERQKSTAIRKLGAGLKLITQEGDAEFIGELAPEAVKTALFEVLRVRRVRRVSETVKVRLRSFTQPLAGKALPGAKIHQTALGSG